MSKAFSKKQALAYTSNLLDNDPGNPDLVALVLHFAPKIPAKPKTSEQWLARFVAKPNGTRVQLQDLYSDGSRLIGCDGHTLAWAPTVHPKGYYCPKTMRPLGLDADLVYPDIDKVIPPLGKPLYDEVSRVDDIEDLRVREVNGIFSRDINGTWFNDEYLKRVTCCGPFDITGTRNGCIRGSCSMGDFVIMGLAR